MTPNVIRAKVDGVHARLKQAREEYYLEASRCAGLLCDLQAICPHTAQQDQPGHAARCMWCDMAMEDLSQN
jgi:hypothetical protein